MLINVCSVQTEMVLCFWMKTLLPQIVVLLGSSEDHLKCVKTSHSAVKIRGTIDTRTACISAHVRECGCEQASVLLLPAPGLQIILRLLQNTLQNFCLLSKLITLVGQIKQGALNGTQTWREWSAGGKEASVCVCVPEKKPVRLCVN